MNDRELEELALPFVGSPLRLKFDPRVHPRDRIGKFAEHLGKLMRAPHGSTVELPHGHMVRRDARGLAVIGGGKEVELGTPHAAAAEALIRHAQAEVGRGADFRKETAALIDELASAKRQVAATDVGDYQHLDARMRGIRKSRQLEPGPASHVGRTAQSRRTDIPSYARNRPVGHPFHGLRDQEGDASKQAQNLERAMQKGKESQARAMTGREIDATTRKVTRPRLERALSTIAGRANRATGDQPENVIDTRDQPHGHPEFFASHPKGWRKKGLKAAR